MPAPRPLRIVHMAATPSGAPWMLALLAEQRRRGHDVSAVIAGGEGTIAPALARLGIRFETFDFNVFSARGIAGAAARALALVRLLRRLGPDVVHTHLFPTIVLGRLAAYSAGVPLRYSMIPGPYYLESPILTDLEAGTAWADTRVFATCENSRELLRKIGVPEDRIDLVYYGVDPSAFDPAAADGPRVRRELGIAPEAPVVGLVAYFYARPPASPITPPDLVGVPIKGHDVLLAAIPKVLARVPGTTFVLVGGGWGAAGEEHMAEMRSLAVRLGVERSVVFAGERRDVPDCLAAFDVALQTSRSENLGGSMEALLLARPLVVSAVGGLVDAVRNGETGLTVPPGDPDALAGAIVRLLEDRALSGRLGRSGRSLMLERFTVSRTAEDLEERYARDLRAPAPKGGLALTARLLRTAARTLPLLSKVKRGLSRAAREAAAGLPPSPCRVALVAGVSVGSTWLADHARVLRGRGWDVVVYLADGPGDLAERVAATGAPVRRLPLWVGERPRRALSWLVHIPRASLRLARAFRRDGVTLVNGHLFTSVLISRSAAFLAGIPHVGMIPATRHLEAPATWLADRMTWWMDAVTVAGCEATRGLYRRFGRDDGVETVYYGCDPAAFRPRRTRGEVRSELGLADDDEVVVHVAHFYPPQTGVQVPKATRGVDLKGREHLLAAARILFARRPRAKLLLVGGGWGDAGEAWRTRLRETCAQDQALASRVVFTGHRDDVPDLLAASDVAVQCSLTESLGGTLEALLLERPTVATRVGGMPESVRDGKTGLLVPPGDAGALAGAIETLLADPAKAAALGREGRRLVFDRFTLERTVDDLERIFTSLGAFPAREKESA